jgi:hypothetical protein
MEPKRSKGYAHAVKKVAVRRSQRWWVTNKGSQLTSRVQKAAVGALGDPHCRPHYSLVCRQKRLKFGVTAQSALGKQ